MIGLLVPFAFAADPCDAFFTPDEVVEAALRMDGARRASADVEAERRVLVVRLACVSEPLSPGDAAAVHIALSGSAPPPVPAATPDDAQYGPPHPEGGVSIVDGVAHAAVRPSTPAIVQAFDAEGKVVYTRLIDASRADAIREGSATMPSAPTQPKLEAIPLRTGEIVRIIASGALVAASGALFVVAADARADWYAIDPSPVANTSDLERLRVKNNVAQGAGLACAGLGAVGLLTVAVRVPF